MVKSTTVTVSSCVKTGTGSGRHTTRLHGDPGPGRHTGVAQSDTSTRLQGTARMTTQSTPQDNKGSVGGGGAEES